MNTARASWRSRVARFLRNCVTGLVATAGYFAVYAPLYWWLHLPQWVADNAGLVVGAVLQFVGARYFVFRATGGRLRTQIPAFILAELATLLLNMGLLALLRLVLPPAIATADWLVLASSFVVFAGFSYPIWHLVFRSRTTPPGQEPASSQSVA